jgi:hypothetical protein
LVGLLGLFDFDFLTNCFGLVREFYSVAVLHHFYVAPATGKNFDAAPAQAALAPAAPATATPAPAATALAAPARTYCLARQNF